MTEKYGDLQVWSSLGIKEYAVVFDDSIVLVNGSTATADMSVHEKIRRADGDSGAVYVVVFSLLQENGSWKITKVDEVTDAETGM